MQVNLRSLKELFEPNRVYRVPHFQRHYVWTMDEQWEPLWDDVRESAEKCLRDDVGHVGPVDQSHLADHFLGAVVIQHEDSNAEVEIRSLIDGQQRLVTLQLLLGAIEEVFEGHAPSAAKRIGLLTNNRDEFVDGDEELLLKVQPTAADIDDYRAAVSRLSISDSIKGRSILEARKYFLDETSKWIELPGDDAARRVRALERAVRDHIKMVVIELANSDDEHLIFETLNARGTPLTDWDLTRNFFLNEGAQAGIRDEQMRSEVLDFFEDDWWFEEIRTGGAPRARVDLFLNYWMIMRTASPVEAKPRVTLRAIEKHAANDPYGVMSVARDMKWSAEKFQEIDEYNDYSKRFGVFLRRWRAMRVGVLAPTLLRVLVEEPAETTLNRALAALESYVIRRQLCGLTTRGYYDLSLGALKAFEEDASSDLDQILIAYLLDQDQSSDRYRWPNDQDVQGTLLTRKMFGPIPKVRLRVILEGIEEGLRTNMSDAGPIVGSLSVEHIMPQAWRDHWDAPVSSEDSDVDPAVRRDELIHTMGNLTLVTKRLNASMSNAALDQKREALDAHSTLFLNKDVLAHSANGWSEAAIEARALRLAAAAIRTWPRPEVS